MHGGNGRRPSFESTERNGGAGCEVRLTDEAVGFFWFDSSFKTNLSVSVC